MINKIQKTLLADTVYEKIKEELLSGKYKEGSLIPSENKFASLLSVSRVVVRVALDKLRKENVIVTRRGKGSFLSNPKNFLISENYNPTLNYSSFQNIMDFRFCIEQFAIRQAVKSASKEDIQNVVDASNKMKDCANDLDAFNEADYEFHLAIVKCTKNDLLVKSITDAKNEIIKCINAMNSLPNSRDFALSLHEKISQHFALRQEQEIINILKNNGEYNLARMKRLLFEND